MLRDHTHPSAMRVRDQSVYYLVETKGMTGSRNMSVTTTETSIKSSSFTISLHPPPTAEKGSPGQPTPKERGQGPFESYPYADLLPKVFPQAGEPIDPPLEDFEHVDPGMRALKHENPRAFLDNATKITHMCPAIGTEVEGVNLCKLTNDERDQLALEVARRKLMVRAFVRVSKDAE